MPPLSPVASKRGPTVLVTDSREPRRQAPMPERPSHLFRRQTSRLITVDNVLQYASDVPSMQRRYPENRPAMTTRTKSGKPAAPKLTGRVIPPHVPSRSTKVSEKLVLLPETSQPESEVEEKADFQEDNEAAPERDDEELLRKTGGKKGKSYAERLPKSRRAEKLARVTAYCTAQAYKLKPTAKFLKDRHAARTKLYDDCLYAVYHLPLLPGKDGQRVRGSPVLKSPGGKAVLDERIECNERRDYGEGFFEDDDQFSIRGNEENGGENASLEQQQQKRQEERARRASNHLRRASSPSNGRLPQDTFAFAEMFVFSYGVVVFWNFTERQEKDILADLTFSSSSPSSSPASPLLDAPPTTTLPQPSLVTAPQAEEDFETEEFHFEYSPDIPRPRVFNDMITLRSGDHMIKLTMSHPIAQSTKLSYFEQQMSNQMQEAQHVPRRLALTGKLGLKRKEVVKILGALFKNRVDVNLSSNVLDTPDFFWSSEPTLHPLYTAVREYLEIKPRIQVLNERCRVFLDLAEILTDSIADTKMSRLTWIIIVLILISILITCSEVFLRFGLLSNRTRRLPPSAGGDDGGVDAALGVLSPFRAVEALVGLAS